MAHRCAFEADSDLDDIWFYIARKSQSVEIADRRSIRFQCDSCSPRDTLMRGGRVIGTFGAVCGAFRLVNT